MARIYLGEGQNHRVCQDEVQKARDQLELHLAQDFKDQKKDFCYSLGDRRKSSENVGSARWGTCLCRTWNRLEILNELLGSVFIVLQESQVPEILGKV